MKTVAVFAKADRQSTHRYKADESYEVGRGKAPVAAYLDYESVIRCAKENGAQAIHPGYGLLSENADFARRCEEEGIVLIGPRSQTLMEMGDKVIAKAKAKECGLPLVPGTEEATANVDDALAFAKEFGMPIMLKAAMGGGGRGMRVVKEFTRARGCVQARVERGADGVRRRENVFGAIRRGAETHRSADSRR